MIGETGENLGIVITTETGKDWETFSTWYSISKSLPNAQVMIACQRNATTPFQYLQWSKRLNIPSFRHKAFGQDSFANRLHAGFMAQSNNLVTEHILLIDPLVTILYPLDETLMRVTEADVSGNDGAWFFKRPNFSALLYDYVVDSEKYKEASPVCWEAKESEMPQTIVSYKKGCGKWIDTLRGCPFSNAAGLCKEDMTVNETKIIEMWKQLASLYSSVA